MPRQDIFKQVYLALIVMMLGLTWMFIPFALVELAADLELNALNELRIIVPTAALLLGATQVARCGTLPARSGVKLTLAVFGLGCALAIVGELGLAALLRPIAAITVAPQDILFPAVLWALQSVTAWMFGGWVLGVLFWSRPGLDSE